MTVSRAVSMAIGALALLAGPAWAGGDSDGGGGDHDRPTDLPAPPPKTPTWHIYYVHELTPEELRKRAQEWADQSPIDVLTIEQRMQWIADHGGWYPGANPIDSVIGLFIP